ncbi:hypothetical protein GGR57DRAFT_486359 [Xylariaceae sp. FL1272]|nr:hypothetical protein GGR57DRAFT_486359 [Xylariaceae sp. FL1272]
MPDPLTLLGATAAGAQFVGYSIKSLIELITLLQGFRDTPEQIHLLLCDAKKSIERLSQLRDYVQTPNAHIAESLTASQIQRIQQTTNDASEPMNQLHALLLPLAQRADGTPHKGVTKSWNTVKSLLRMREVENKLSRIQRLHSDLLQELQISDLQLQATMSSNIAKLSTSINSFGSGLMSIETATTLANSEIRHTRNDIAMLTTDQKILVSELTAMRPAFDEVYAANHHILAREEQNSHRLQSLESTMEIILKSLTDPSRDRPNFDHVSITRISDADKEDIVRGVSRSLVERPSALRGVLDASTSTIAHPMPKRGNRHSDNKKTTSFALRLRPLLDRTLKLSFSINISLWAYRSVKRSESPIFQRLDEASEDIRKAYRRTSVERPQSTQTLQSGIEIILTKLLDNLRRLSKSEGACLADRDEIGRSPFQVEIFRRHNRLQTH